MKSIYHQGQLDDTLSGADKHAPSFSRGLSLLESAAAERERGILLDDNRMLLGLMAENRETTMRLVRMEAERTKEQRERAEFLERQLAEEYLKPRRAWIVSAALSFGFWAVVFWLVTR